jgi:hypothetical protein
MDSSFPSFQKDFKKNILSGVASDILSTADKKIVKSWFKKLNLACFIREKSFEKIISIFLNALNTTISSATPMMGGVDLYDETGKKLSARKESCSLKLITFNLMMILLFATSFIYKGSIEPSKSLVDRANEAVMERTVQSFPLSLAPDITYKNSTLVMSDMNDFYSDYFENVLVNEGPDITAVCESKFNNPLKGMAQYLYTRSMMKDAMTVFYEKTAACSYDKKILRTDELMTIANEIIADNLETFESLKIKITENEKTIFMANLCASVAMVGLFIANLPESVLPKKKIKGAFMSLLLGSAVSSQPPPLTYLSQSQSPPLPELISIVPSSSTRKRKFSQRWLENTREDPSWNSGGMKISKRSKSKRSKSKRSKSKRGKSKRSKSKRSKSKRT